MVATSPEHMPETRQEVRNGREPRVPAPAWDNSPPSGRSAAVAYLLWEQVVAGSIPAAPTSTSASLARDLLTHRRATRPDAASIARLVPSLRCASRGARLLPPGRLLAPRQAGPDTGPSFRYGCSSSLAKSLTGIRMRAI